MSNMNGSQTIGFLALFLATFQVALCQMSAQVFTSQLVSFHRNDTLVVTCDVTNKKAESFFITWNRVVEGEDVEIGTSAHINKPFNKSGRYKADYHTDTPHDISHVRFHLNITDVTTADTGKIGCKIPSKGVVLFKPFTVYEPVKSMKLVSTDINGAHAIVYSDGQNATFKEDEVLKITCTVNGSYPAPKVKVMVGDRDLTSLFTRTQSLHRIGATKGLQELYYEVHLTNNQMTIDYDFDNTELECVASMPETKFTPVSIAVNISLIGYKPKFLCSKIMERDAYEMNTNISCTVRAQPPADDFKFTWQNDVAVGSKANTTLHNVDRPNKKLNSELLEGKSDLETVMMLKFVQLFPQYFRTYYFEATNELGSVVFPIELVPRGYDSSELRSDTGQLLSSFPLLLVAYLLPSLS